MATIGEIREINNKFDRRSLDGSLLWWMRWRIAIELHKNRHTTAMASAANEAHHRTLPLQGLFVYPPVVCSSFVAALGSCVQSAKWHIQSGRLSCSVISIFVCRFAFAVAFDFDYISLAAVPGIAMKHLPTEPLNHSLGVHSPLIGTFLKF